MSTGSDPEKGELDALITLFRAMDVLSRAHLITFAADLCQKNNRGRPRPRGPGQGVRRGTPDGWRVIEGQRAT